MSKCHFLIISGDGINCEKESRFAVEQAGGSAEIVHLNNILKNPPMIHNFDGIVIPGGFSFGDDIGSGRIFAQKIQSGMRDQFSQFINDAKPVIGICNGFQTLMQLGVFENPTNDKRTITLTHNESGKFIDMWVSLKVNSKTKCIWTKGLEKLDLPIRHGEGRIVFSNLKQQEKFDIESMAPLTYINNPNGAAFDIAGLCNPQGNVLGLMPHPEAALYRATDPLLTKTFMREGDGLKLFKNAIEYIKNRKES